MYKASIIDTFIYWILEKKEVQVIGFGAAAEVK